MSLRKKQKVPEQGNKLAFTPRPLVSYLETLSPTDECFTEAISSRKSVFPATKEERDTLAAQKKEAEGAAAAKNYELAARIAKQYKQEKLEVNQKDLEFELVFQGEPEGPGNWIERGYRWSLIIGNIFRGRHNIKRRRRFVATEKKRRPEL